MSDTKSNVEISNRKLKTPLIACILLAIGVACNTRTEPTPSSDTGGSPRTASTATTSPPPPTPSRSAINATDGVTKPAPLVAAAPEDSLPADLTQAERGLLSSIGSKMVESPAEILRLTDQGITGVQGPPGTKKLSRLQFLYLAAGVLDTAKEDPQIRKRLTVNKQGKYRYDQVATVVFLLAMKTAYN